ncbi:MAG: cyclic nucleotide-binding domain-containing protein [Verrucomicrobia bacterium]|nr:cyclic nucleotide-binding domain-containing protein [Verrucomicrobiota bacterium]
MASDLEKSLSAELEEVVVLLRRYGTTVALEPGDLVVAKGKRLNALYFIESGCLEPAWSTQDVVAGNWRLGPGSCLGDMGLLVGAVVAPVDLVCIDPGVMYELSVDAFAALVTREEHAAVVLYRYLARSCAGRLAAMQDEFTRLRMLLVIR